MPAQNSALVLGSSRRWVELLTSNGGQLLAKKLGKIEDVVVGDTVDYHLERDEAVVTAIQPRKNALSRSYEGKMKFLASNLDELFIVSAILPLFNTTFIDRILSVAFNQDIPVTLILNKIDLGLEQTKPLVEPYQEIGFRVFYCSAKFGEGLGPIQAHLGHPSKRIVCLTGISGVGKSTLINKLVPNARQQTADVSERTGQGKQTTSAALGVRYSRPGGAELIMIDLPGVQKIGITHLSKEDLANSFPEIVQHRTACRFSNCSHILEEECAVKEAVRSGQMTKLRYESYSNMIAEVEEARPY